MYKYFHNNHASFFLSFSNGYDKYDPTLSASVDHISLYFSKLKNFYFFKASNGLEKAGGGCMIAMKTFTNVSERLRISSENIPHILRIPYYGPRVHEKYRKLSLIQSLA